MRAPALAALLALLLPLAAGCITSSDAGLTAKEAASKAAPRAQQWHADAALVGLGAAEVSAQANFSDPGFDLGMMGLPVPRDAKVGDGRAPAWGLFYVSPSANRSLDVVVFPNGTVLADEGRGSREDVLQRWSVDSPQALDAARKDAGVAGILAAPDAIVFEGVGMENNLSDPVWGLFLRSPSLGRVAQVAVSASNGELLGARTFNGSLFGGGGSPPPSTKFSFDGSVSPDQPTMKHAFPVAAGQSVLQVQFSYTGQLPTDGASFEVRDAQGQALQPATPVPTSSGSQQYEETFVATGPGTYTAVVSYESQAVPGLPVPGIQSTSYTMAIKVT